MANMNRIILVGRLTKDPELRYMVDGTPLTKFSLAVDRDRKTDDTHQVDFIPVVTWRKLAEICGEYLKKGRLVLVEGRIQVRSYEAQNGVKKWATEVVAGNMQMLGGPAKAKVAEVEVEAPSAADVPATDAFDDIPESEVPDEEDLPF